MSVIVEGGCHCRRVRFRAELEALDATECNCSICTMKGFVHVFVDGAAFELLSGADALRTYTFNTGVAQHHFCGHCGIAAFYVPRSHPDGYSLNLRCLDGDYAENRARFTVRPFDGQRWEASIDGLVGQ